MKQPLFLTGQYYLFLEQAEGYVKTPRKIDFSTLDHQRGF